MSKENDCSKEELYQEFKIWTEHLIKKIPTHKTAPETVEMITTVKDDMNDKFNKLNESVSDLHVHFGDKGIITRMDKNISNTNGRVKKLELWKSFLLGSWAVISVIMPLFFYLYIQEIKHEISSEITAQIEKNNNHYFE